MATFAGSPAVAKGPKWLQDADVESKTELSEAEARDAIDECLSLSESRLIEERKDVLISAGLLRREQPESYKANRFSLASGAVRTSAVAIFGELYIVVHHYVSANNEEHVAARAFYLETKGDDPEILHCLFDKLDDGVAPTALSEVSSIGTQEGRVTMASKCTQSQCMDRNRCYRCNCKKHNAKCIGKCCHGCVAACFAGPKPCIACALVACAACVEWFGDCCLESKCERYASKTC